MPRTGAPTRKPTLAETMTDADFKRRAEALFRRGNSDTPTASIVWEDQPLLRWWTATTPYVPTMTGFFRVAAEGYRPRRMIASWTKGEGMMVR